MYAQKILEHQKERKLKKKLTMQQELSERLDNLGSVS
jgi:hypothetical protein